MSELFDAHLHPESLSDEDITSLAFFGVKKALLFPNYAATKAEAPALLAHFERAVRHELPRFEAHGVKGYLALGVDPRCVPRRGLSEVLSALPRFFQGGRVVALGELGLHHGTAAEEEALIEQLSLARRLKLPVVLHTPKNDKPRHTKRMLALVRESGLPPARVLFDHLDGRTVKAVLAHGHFAGLTVHPEALKAERTVALVRELGPTRVVLGSDAGNGPSDLTALARTERLLEKGRLSAAVIARVCHDNAVSFLRLE